MQPLPEVLLFDVAAHQLGSYLLLPQRHLASLELHCASILLVGRYVLFELDIICEQLPLNGSFRAIVGGELVLFEDVGGIDEFFLVLVVEDVDVGEFLQILIVGGYLQLILDSFGQFFGADCVELVLDG